MAKELVRKLVGEAARAFEHVVQMGLREAGLAGEAAFGGFPAVEHGAKAVQEAVVEVGEVHRESISHRNRGRAKALIAIY
ncbi:MAG: hypothetical protein ACP5U2_16760 [Bryobacteraceae bacterium]